MSLPLAIFLSVVAGCICIVLVVVIKAAERDIEERRLAERKKEQKRTI